MGLDFGSVETRKIKLRVWWRGEELEFYAEEPTTEERVNYRRDIARCFNRRGEPDFDKLSRVQIRWAKRKLVGFREGDLTENGKPISQNDGKWKDLLEEKAPEILEGIAGQLFTSLEDVSVG